MSRTTGCLLIVLLFSIRLTAVQYPFINYKTADGLPQNYVTAISQDNQGYIWVGTQSGVGIFNGQAFIRTISTSDGLPGSYINDIIPGLAGRMWVATSEGLTVLNKRVPEKDFLSGLNVTRLFIDPGKRQVLGLAEGRLYRFNLQGETNELSIPGLPDTLSIDHATMDQDGHIYIVAGGRVLRGDAQSHDQWTGILEEPSMELLCSRRNRILLVADGWIRSLDTKAPSVRIPLPEGCGAVSDLDMDVDGSLWLGTRTGLYSLADPSKQWQRFHAGNGMHFSTVTRVFVDREHTVFAGTRFGLSHLSSVIFRMYKREDGLPSEFICCMLEDEPDRVLLGGYEGLAEIHAGRIRPMKINPALENRQVRTILKIDSRNYLIGTRYNGIFHWDRGNKLRLLHADAQVMNGLKDSGGTFWFGTDHGMIRSDGRHFTRITSGLNHIRVWALAEWTPGVLIVGTGHGVQVFNQGDFIRSDLETRLGTVNVTDIQVSSDSQEIMVSTVVNGLFLYNKGQVTHLSTENGLLHNDVWYSLRDNQGNIWMNTSVSLDRYHDGYISHFSKKTGLFGDEGFIHAALKTASGTLFFGVSPGIVELRPGTREFTPEIPQISNLEVRVNNESRPLDSLLELKSRENSLDFSFFAVTTRLDNPVYYRWRLLPLEQKWGKAVRRSSVRYANLPPGKYSFEVTSDNGLRTDTSSLNPNRIHFTIRGPLWLRWWFVLIVLVVLLVVFRLAIALRLRMLEIQKRRLEKRIHEHTRELARKNNELVVLSTTDPLTGLKNRRYLDDKITEEVHLVERSLYQGDRGHSDLKEDRVLTFFIIDIDHFKMVNDIHGHHSGDQVLKGIAHALRKELRTSDTLIRWGGEEFLVVTRNKRSGNSYQLAERLRTAISSREFRISSQESVRKTVSVGFARFPFIAGDPRIITWQQVISLADSALYLAKLNGRDLSVGIEPGPGFTDIPFSEIITRLSEQAAAGRIRLSSTRHELVFRSAE